MYSFIIPLTSTLGKGGWSSPRPGLFTSGKDPVPIVQEAGWAPGQVWTRAENLVPHRERSPAEILSSNPTEGMDICLL
jgi:hypothetical protein